MTFINALIFFLIALVYSSAGFGGGSLYLAVLSQSGMDAGSVRFAGLCCNAVVTANGSYMFWLKKWIVWKSLIPLLLFSVVPCIMAASLSLNADEYYITLGFCLLISGLLMLCKTPVSESTRMNGNKWWHFPLSAVIGFLAGITGIGGGVYLSPMLHLSRWGSAKHIAAASSVFILVNSLAGIFTQLFVHHQKWENSMFWLLLAVTLGGLIGSRMSSSILSQKAVRYLTIGLIIFASLRILIRYL